MSFALPAIDTLTVTHYAHAVAPALGAFLAVAGLIKRFTKWEAGWAVYRNNGFSRVEYHNTAVIEVVGAVGLIFRPTRFAGVITLILMIAWIETQTKLREKRDVVKPKFPLSLQIPARITQVLLVGFLWAFWPDSRMIVD